ncbi:MAG TPA: hypothetical protein VK026_00400 [Paenalcaligenes sp.]|nr:hypothetical protein [Paenalcaligenes sp.]
MNQKQRSLWRSVFVTGASVGVLSLLTACGSFLAEGTSAGAGIAGVAIADRVTDNAAVATGIGLGVQAAAKAGLQYAQRQTRGAEHDAITRAASGLAVGDVAQWAVIHSVPLEPDSQGSVTVSRHIQGQGMQCKEIVFSHAPMSSVDPVLDSAYFVAMICENADGWRWASAEPATARWGALQ